MSGFEFYQQEFNAYIKYQSFTKDPKRLYEPVDYIMGLGGKRLRPALLLSSADLLGGSYKAGLAAAMAVEVFHNFTLVHDDIMDDAPIRRGKATVHEKWDVNTGILSGDAMLIKAYQYFEEYEGDTYKELMKVFNRTALEVCEGQQYDMDFETREDVSIAEYLQMIAFKTAVLLAASLQMGAIVARASAKSQLAMYDFGLHLGMAFQLQDDYLDAFGDPKSFGKQIGGDIIENKKTFLYLKALELADTDARKDLLDLYTLQPKDPTEKIRIVKEIFQLTGAADRTREEIAKYTDKAHEAIGMLEVKPEARQTLTDFAVNLMNRVV